MKRVIFIEDCYGGKSKYVLKREYEGFGVYQHMCPSGYFTHQDYLVTEDYNPDNKPLTVISHSYTGICLDELLDMIDTYKEENKLYQKVINKYDTVLCRDVKIIHLSGKEE